MVDTTNLVGCMSFVLKSACNLPIMALVRMMYFQLAELFAKKGREVYVRRATGNIFVEAVMT